MKGRIKNFLGKLILCLAVVSYSCSDEAYVAIEYSPVNYNINEMPYENLSQYNFFQGELKNLDPMELRWRAPWDSFGFATFGDKP